MAVRSRTERGAPSRGVARGGSGAVLEEVPPGIEPGMEVLQTSALPLGYGTGKSGQPGSNR